MKRRYGRWMNGTADAVEGFFGAFTFLISNRMGWLLLLPALLWIALAFGLFVLLEGPVDRLTAWLSDLLRIEVERVDEGFWRDLLQVMDGAREVLVLLVLKLAIAYLMFTFNKYIVLILLSPVLAYVSERTEEILTGRNYRFSWPQLLRDASRGSLVALRNGILEATISIGIWIFTFFAPLAAPFTVVILFMVSAYFYGFSMYDYIFERRRMNVRESVRAVNERIPMVLTNGVLFSLLMKLPLIGMMLAPLMAAAGAVRSMRSDPMLAPAERVPLK